ASIATLRTAFARDLVHRLAHRKRLPFKLLADHARMDLGSFLAMPGNMVKLILKK
ncbi:MAG: hypothetical protein JWP29_2914, partial [Rhodoferax sp.]|nr:hypothetical protein [Rhodoferax sp.]